MGQSGGWAGRLGQKAGDLQDRVGDDAVARLVRVLVRAAGRGSALPGPLADPRHVAGQGTDPGDRHRMAEIGGVERSEDVGNAIAGLGVRLVEQVGEGDVQPCADPRDRAAQGAVAPLREIGQVVAHPDDAHGRARRRAQAAQDRDQPRRGLGDLADAGGEPGQFPLAPALLGIVGADINGHEQHVPAMGAQEGDRGGELRTAGVTADAAVHHRLGGLTGAPELHQPQRGMGEPQLGVHQIRVTLPRSRRWRRPRRAGPHGTGSRPGRGNTPPGRAWRAREPSTPPPPWRPGPPDGGTQPAPRYRGQADPDPRDPTGQAAALRVMTRSADCFCAS